MEFAARPPGLDLRRRVVAVRSIPEPRHALGDLREEAGGRGSPDTPTEAPPCGSWGRAGPAGASTPESTKQEGQEVSLRALAGAVLSVPPLTSKVPRPVFL